MTEKNNNIYSKLKSIFIGKARNPYDKSLFHKLSLVAFFAWVGLGADGLSSSSYGPEEAFLALGEHIYLGIFVAIASAITIFVISASYHQIVELFPFGGGGYLVASKLLSPQLGVVAGCALLIDYVLTITLSIASGADAIFSFLPKEWLPYKLSFAVFGVLLILILNLRGVRESVVPLVPIFLTFIITHLFMISYSFFSHFSDMGTLVNNVQTEISHSFNVLGTFGVFLLVMKAYSMGAGTFTGIEAVSNGLPILREPRVQTAKTTMHYMAISLAVMVVGLMLSYLLYNVSYVPGMTLNAVLFNTIAKDWGTFGYVLVLITLISEAAILFIAAQTGFLGGPRVLANMALDRYMPHKFTMLSDRFVTHNGIIFMSASSLILMIATSGSVKYLVVLYAINVFITFCLSQLGMVKYSWSVRKTDKKWFRKLSVNGVGLILTSFILISVTILKFQEGGWITITITGSLIVISLLIKRHYNNTNKLLKRLDELVSLGKLAAEQPLPPEDELPKYDKKSKTAVIFINGFNGLGLHTLFGIMRLFKNQFKNFIFIHIGILDAGNFKGIEEIKNLEMHTKEEAEKYVRFCLSQGFYAESITSIGNDLFSQIDLIHDEVSKKFTNYIYFGGQLVFPEDTWLTRWLHNNVVFTIQRRLYQQGVPFIILPIRVY